MLTLTTVNVYRLGERSCPRSFDCVERYYLSNRSIILERIGVFLRCYIAIKYVSQKWSNVL